MRARDASRGRMGRARREQEHPVTETVVEEVQIESLAYGGDGVGHLSDGRAVFVPLTVPGDTVRIHLTHTAERFARGELEEVLSPSKDRVKPTCPNLACGGCPWQHIAYSEQLVWKRRAVVDNLVRTGRFDAQWAEEVVEPCVGSKRQWNYRNKVEFEVQVDEASGQERITLGLHAPKGGFVPVTSCAMLPKRFAGAPKSLTGALRFALSGDPVIHDIERVGVRVSLETGCREVALWTKPGAFPRGRVAKIVTDAVHATSVVRVLAKGPIEERKVSGVEVLAGSGTWFERIGDERMHLTAPSFFQVNTAQAAKLVELVLENLEPTEADVVLDLYCGAGTFTLPLAATGAEVIGVESYGSSIRDLRRNLFDAGLDGEVVGGDVARELAHLPRPDLAVVDPPRSGLSPEATKAIARLKCRKLCYVSCDPATLARDLKALAGPDGRFKIERITPVDLFPQTYHVETVVLLKRDKG